MDPDVKIFSKVFIGVCLLFILVGWVGLIATENPATCTLPHPDPNGNQLDLEVLELDTLEEAVLTNYNGKILITKRPIK